MLIPDIFSDIFVHLKYKPNCTRTEIDAEMLVLPYCFHLLKAMGRTSADGKKRRSWAQVKKYSS